MEQRHTVNTIFLVLPIHIHEYFFCVYKAKFSDIKVKK